MASLPTDGGSDGTWGTEMNEFLLVEHDTDGTHDIHDSEGGYMQVDVNGTKTNVYTKYFTGTLDSDSETTVAHGISGAPDNILAVIVSCEGSGSLYRAGDYAVGATSANAFIYYYNSTNVVITSVGSDNQGNSYHIRIDYIL